MGATRRPGRTALVVLQLLVFVTYLLGPTATFAEDPAPDPSPSESAAPEATPDPTPDPTPEPTAEPTPQPTPEPTPEATPEPTPVATPEATPEPTPTPAGEPVPYLITFAAGTSAARQLEILDATGATDVEAIPQLAVRSITLDANTISAQLAALIATPEVRRVETDRVRDAGAAPNDASYADQWSLPHIGWEELNGTVAIAGTATVAILDTGVQAGHPDLDGVVLPGWSALPGADPMTDPNGHGTWMAGIVAAETDNGIGVAGTAYAGVSVLPITVLGADGTGQDSDIIAGVVHAADADADVILMAFSNPGFSAALQAAIDYAWASGSVLVAATGNDGASTATFPAGDRGVIGVTSTDASDAVAASANRGPAAFMAAPGVDILTTASFDPATAQPGDEVVSISGTSAAAASVAGAAALLAANEPELSNGVVVSRLARTADAAGDPADTGNGRLNLLRAMSDASTDAVQPAGAAPVGEGGPLVGPYVAAGSGVIAITVRDSATNAVIAGATVTCTAQCTGSGNTGTTNALGVAQFTVNYSGNSETITLSASKAGYTSNTGSLTVANSNNTANPATATILLTAADTTAPTVSSINRDSATPTNATSVSWTVTFSESVTGVDAADFSLVATGGVTGASITSVSGSGATRIVTASTGTGDGSLGLNLVDDDSIVDTANNKLGGTGTTGASNGSFTGQVYVIDKTAPTVSSINRDSATPTNATSVSWTVTFSESVTGVDAADFSLVATGGVTGASITSVSGSGATRIVTASTGTGDGSLGLNLVDDDSIVDTANNKLGGTGTTGASNGSFTGQVYVIDKTAPTVSSINRDSATPTNATSVSWTVTFSESVTGVDAADFSLVATGGVTGASITSVSGSGATRIVTASTGTGDGSLGLNLVDDDSIVDTANNKLGGTGTTGASNGSFTGQVYVIDKTAPTVSSINRDSATPTNATSVSWTVTFSESVTGVDAADFSLVATGGVTGASITSVSGSGATRIVTASTGTGDGSLGLNLVDDDSIVDTANNKLGGTGTTGANNGSFTGQVYVIDKTAPETTIDDSPAAESNDTTPSFEFSGTDNHSADADLTFECSVDGAAFASCTSPADYTLAEGAHTFAVRATDEAGNTDATPAQFSWIIDLTEPNTTITDGPDDPTNSTSASFDFTATDPDSGGVSSGVAGSECRLDSSSPADWVACSSGVTYTSLGEGSHTFEVRSTDQAGNLETTPDSFTWFVDLTAPETTIDDSPAAESNDTTPSFEFSGTDNHSADADLTFECSVDGAAFASCTSPADYTLAEGAHTFAVRATDEAGNTDATPAQFSWIIDLTEPNTTITDGPDDPTNSTSASFDFTATDPDSGGVSSGVAGSECRLDSSSPADWVACSSGVTYTSLGEGSHTFEVRSTDQAGNLETTPDSFTWFVDLTAPETTIDDSPAAESNDTTPSFEFSGTDNHSADADLTFECSVDGAAFASCTSPADYTLAEGAHTFAVRATDEAGNTDATPAQFSWIIDLTEPNTTITDGPDDPTNSTSASFDFTATDPDSGGVSSGVAGSECRLDSSSPADWVACSSGVTYTSLGEGSHTFEVRSTDQAGNLETTPDSFTWFVDLTAPETTIDDSPAAESNDTTPSFEFSGTDNHSADADLTFECSVDGAAFASCTSPADYTLAEGAHTFAVRATDEAGNTDATPAQFSWIIDLTEPNTTITDGPDDPTNSTSASFDFTATDPDSGGVSSGVAGSECRLDSSSPADWVACSSGVTYTSLGEGSHTFEVRSTDQAGNLETTPDSFTWLIDVTDPAVAITFPAHGGAYSELSWNAGCAPLAGDFCGTASDGGSGLESVEVSVYRAATDKFWDGTSFSSDDEIFSSVGTASPWDEAFPFANFPSTGSYTIHVVATDEASNASDASATFQINRYSLDFLPPIDDSTTGNIAINTGKNGRVIPVKVRVFLEGVNQSSAQIAEGRLTISVNKVVCGSAAVVDGVEQYADAGASNANTNAFRPTSDHWIYNLDTKALGLTTNQCYRLDVYLDGVRISTQEFAIFKPVK